jgi:hypothetical protein
MAAPATSWAIVDTGAISGVITNHHTGDPVGGARVCASPYLSARNTSACVATDGSGKYEIVGLESNGATGEKYEVSASHAGLVNAYAYEIVVKAGETTENVDLALSAFGSIRGVVTAGGVPVEDVDVCADGPGYGCDETAGNGEYEITDLAPGSSYSVYFEPPYKCALEACSTPYLFQYWDAAPVYEGARLVTVEEDETTSSINAALQTGGAISGRVTSAATGKPIAATVVCAYVIGVGEVEACAVTNAAGEYTDIGLLTGTYELEFDGNVCVESHGETTCTRQWVEQYYQGLVSVTQPATTSGVNIALVERGHEKPVDNAAPAVIGTTTLGSTLTCSQGSWGNLPTSFTYQWLRNGAAIAGQTTPTYTVAIADEGTSLSCTVTATDAAGSTAATSTALAIAKPTPGVGGVTGVSVKGSKASVTLKCTGQTACLGKLELVVHVTVRGHGKHKKATVHTVVIGTAALSIAAGASETVQVHLSSAGQKLLHAAGKKGLKIEFTGSGVTTATKTVK